MTLLISDSCFIFFPCKVLTPCDFCHLLLSAPLKATQAAFKHPGGLCHCLRWYWHSPTDCDAREHVGSGGFSGGSQVGTFCWSWMRCFSQQACPHPQRLLSQGLVPQPQQHCSGSRQLLWLSWWLPDIAGLLTKRSWLRAKQQPFLVEIFWIGLFEF